jgi:hypothetical protein
MVLINTAQQPRCSVYAQQLKISLSAAANRIGAWIYLGGRSATFVLRLKILAETVTKRAWPKK